MHPVFNKFRCILQLIRRGGASTRPLPATIDLIAFISSMALVSADGGTFLSRQESTQRMRLKGKLTFGSISPLRIPHFGGAQVKIL